MVWFATFEFYCRIGMGLEKSLFLFSEREFHLQSCFWCECLPKLKCNLHVYSNMKQQKASICASETLSRKCLCTRTSQHGDNFITKFRRVLMETFLLAALEIILYLELLGMQGILKANRKAKMLPRGSYNLSQTKAEWKCWLHGIKNQKVGTFIWKAKESTKLFNFSCMCVWLLEPFLALA